MADEIIIYERPEEHDQHGGQSVPDTKGALPKPTDPGYTYFTDYLGNKWTCCTCMKEWLTLYQKVAIKRAMIKQGLDVWQLTGGATASAGTHSKGGAFDLLFQTSYAFVMMAREFGADADWKRTVSQGFTKDHMHGVLVGCPHNAPAAYQITAQRDGYNGLGVNGRGGKDTYPSPNPRRTWQQGVTEMKRELGLLAVKTTTVFSTWPNPSIRGDEVEVRAQVQPTNAKGKHVFERSTDNGKTWTAFTPSPVSMNASGLTGGKTRFFDNYLVRAKFVPTDSLAFTASTSPNVTVTTMPVEDIATKDEVAALQKAVADLTARVEKLENPQPPA